MLLATHHTCSNCRWGEPGRIGSAGRQIAAIRSDGIDRALTSARARSAGALARVAPENIAGELFGLPIVIDNKVPLPVTANGKIRHGA